MRNAAAPMIGGIICPPVEAEASTAAANSGLYPVFFIMGTVSYTQLDVYKRQGSCGAGCARRARV